MVTLEFKYIFSKNFAVFRQLVNQIWWLFIGKTSLPYADLIAEITKTISKMSQKKKNAKKIEKKAINPKWIGNNEHTKSTYQ